MTFTHLFHGRNITKSAAAVSTVTNHRWKKKLCHNLQPWNCHLIWITYLVLYCQVIEISEMVHVCTYIWDIHSWDILFLTVPMTALPHKQLVLEIGSHKISSGHCSNNSWAHSFTTGRHINMVLPATLFSRDTDTASTMRWEAAYGRVLYLVRRHSRSSTRGAHLMALHP